MRLVPYCAQKRNKLEIEIGWGKKNTEVVPLVCKKEQVEMKKWRIDKVVGKEMEVVPFSVQKRNKLDRGNQKEESRIKNEMGVVPFCAKKEQAGKGKSRN